MDASFARLWLRLEGFAVLLVSTAAYAHLGLRWLWFVILFLAPDLAMFGYVAGPGWGSRLYNLAHTYALSLVVVAAGLIMPGMAHLLAVGLIWTAHIGFDRALGYGLKSPEGFGQTHLGRIGKAR